MKKSNTEESDRRSTKKSAKVRDKSAPWCVYPERKNCRDCEYSYAPFLSDGGCKLMK